jgi:hypothetical protein
MFQSISPPIIGSTQLYIQLQVLSTNTAASCYCGRDGIYIPTLLLVATVDEMESIFQHCCQLLLWMRWNLYSNTAANCYCGWDGIYIPTLLPTAAVDEMESIFQHCCQLLLWMRWNLYSNTAANCYCGWDGIYICPNIFFSNFFNFSV